MDIQLSCHFVTLLNFHHRDKYPDLVVPLPWRTMTHARCSYSKLLAWMGISVHMIFMNWWHTANILSHIIDVECTRDKLTLKKQHNKMENVWEALHKLQLGEEWCNLGDYIDIFECWDSNHFAIGLKEAHRLFRPLNMVPNPQCPTKKKLWYERLWIVERIDPKSFAYPPSVS